MNTKTPAGHQAEGYLTEDEAVAYDKGYVAGAHAIVVRAKEVIDQTVTEAFEAGLDARRSEGFEDEDEDEDDETE